MDAGAGCQASYGSRATRTVLVGHWRGGADGPVVEAARFDLGPASNAQIAHAREHSEDGFIARKIIVNSPPRKDGHHAPHSHHDRTCRPTRRAGDAR